MQLTDRLNSNDMLLRVFAYGPAKTKKTWWALNAAMANFNVILLDGDDGWHIASQIPKETHHRISIWEVKDQMANPTFAPFLTRLLKDGKITWDESAKKVEMLYPNENCSMLNLNELDSNTILIIDSWTALVSSLTMKFAKENSIDLTDAEKNEWEFYGWAGRLTSFLLNRLKSLPCHVIVIGHSTVYEKKSGKGKQAKTEWARRQPISTSGPAGMQIADKFSDVLFFHTHGTANKIDVSGADDKDGGSRVIPPKDYQWADLQFSTICQAAGLTLPNASNPYLDFAVKDSKPALQTKTAGVIETRTAKLTIGEKPKTPFVKPKPTLKLG